jgi:hypothetical protein
MTRDEGTKDYIDIWAGNLKAFGQVVGVVLLLLLSLQAFGQTTPSVTFGASVTNANGSLSTTLNWSTTPAASSCTAANHPNWTGTKAASGSQVLPPITLSGTYALSLTCTWPGDNQAVVTWTVPTTNADGTALVKCATQTTAGRCLQMWRLYHGPAANDLEGDVRPIDDRNATSYTFTGLAAGQHFFAAEAVNGDGVPSALSNIVSKTLTGATTRTAAVTLTVNPIPSPPTLTVR